jgi:Ca2+-binding RTX toxin-like protein
LTCAPESGEGQPDGNRQPLGAGGVDNLSLSDEPELNALPARLNGAVGNDNLKDLSLANGTLDGGAGNDFMFGSDGNDTLPGGSGNDEVDGEGGSDNVWGGEGDDKLDGDHLKPPAPDVVGERAQVAAVGRDGDAHAEGRQERQAPVQPPAQGDGERSHAPLTH